MLQFITAWINRFETDEEGQGMVEYALILVLISVVAIAAMTTVGQRVTDVFDLIAGALVAA
jgi:pilus assembly protein Flp/PilA